MLTTRPAAAAPTDKYKENDVMTIQQDIAAHVEYTLARTRQVRCRPR